MSACRAFVFIGAFLTSVSALSQTAPLLELATQENRAELVAVTQPIRLAETLRAEAIVTLPQASSVASERIAALAANNSVSGNVPSNGFARPILQPIGLAEATGDGRVARVVTDGGQTVWSTRVAVAGAFRLRLHLDDLSLPPGTELWVFGSGDESVAFSVGEAKDWWTPSIGGGDIRLEVRLPAGTNDQAQFSVVEVMQLFQLDASGSPIVSVTERGETSCLEDAFCYDSGDFPAIEGARRAIAYIQFIKGAGAFVCTGGLINDLDGATTIPYFVTANHCIDTAASAASAEFFFDYETSVCFGAFPNLAQLPRVASSSLEATTVASDHTLLRLSGFPDQNRWLLGWTTSPDATSTGTELFRISHPFGFPQAYSTTTVIDPSETCTGLGTADFLYQEPDIGGTLGGSSGAPLLTSGGLVVGQLLGACGPDPGGGCSAANDEVDGRFSKSFETIGPFLQGSAPACEDDLTNGKVCLRSRFQITGTYTGFSSPTPKPLTWTAGNVNTIGKFQGQPGTQVVMRVADGCPLTDTWWVWLGGFTDAGWNIHVKDTVTNQERTFVRLKMGGEFPTTLSDRTTFPCN